MVLVVADMDMTLSREDDGFAAMTGRREEVAMRLSGR